MPQIHSVRHSWRALYRILGAGTAAVLLSGCSLSSEIASSYLAGLIPSLLFAAVLCYAVSVCFGNRRSIAPLVLAAVIAGLPALVIGVATMEPDNSYAVIVYVTILGAPGVASIALLFHNFVASERGLKQVMSVVAAAVICTVLATISVATDASWPLEVLYQLGLLYIVPLVLFGLLCLRGRRVKRKREQERIQPASAVARKS